MKETADLGVEAVAELPASAPHLDGIDTTVVGVTREIGAPIVAGESDFTHDAVRDRLNVELYKVPRRTNSMSGIDSYAYRPDV